MTLEDAGRFACPHCGNEFEAEHEPEAPKPTPPPLPYPQGQPQPPITKSGQPDRTARRVGLYLLGLGVVLLGLVFLEQIGRGLKEAAQLTKPNSSEGPVAILSQPAATRDRAGTFEITGTALNRTGGNLRDVVITFTLYDRDDSVVGYAIDRLAILEPGQRWRYRAVSFDRDADSYRFRDLSVDLFGRVAVKVEFEK